MTTTQSADPNERVDHPRHYNQHPSNIETIELIEHLPSNLAAAVKYIWRCGLKSTETPLRDLKSAKWYTERERARLRLFELGRYPEPQKTDVVWRALANRVVEFEVTPLGLPTTLGLYLSWVLRHDLNGALAVLGVAVHETESKPPAPPQINTEPYDNEPLKSQCDRLAKFILDECPGYPNSNDGAMDTAIRIIREQKNGTAVLVADQMREAQEAFEKENATVRQVLGEEIAGIAQQRDDLWQILDNIDTLDDGARDDDAWFRKHVRLEHKKRFAIHDRESRDTPKTCGSTCPQAISGRMVRCGLPKGHGATGHRCNFDDGSTHLIARWDDPPSGQPPPITQTQEDCATEILKLHHPPEWQPSRNGTP